MGNLRSWSNFLIAYMILAFGWWAVLLWRSNNDLFEAEKQVLALQQELQHTTDPVWELANLKSKHEHYEGMIIAEGLFFSGCLLAGFLIIRRSVQKEVTLTRQRRNFLLSITHELKSPIASMRLVLETLVKRTLDRDKQVQLSNSGLKDAARLQGLVEDLLLAARLENSWQPLLEPLALTPLVNDCIETLKVRFGERQFQVNIPSGLPLLKADKAGLTSVIINLLENANKYSPPGTPIEITASEIAKKRIRLEIADLGGGIPEAERKEVFEKFYRLGNEETRKTTGTGLGLFIVRQVVEAHGGSIAIRDNQPVGTRFIIEL